MAWASFLINLDLRLEACFLWMIPLLAALSRALTALRTSSWASSNCFDSMSIRAFLTRVFSSERIGMFRARRLAATRIILIADFVLANLSPLPRGC